MNNQKIQRDSIIIRREEPNCLTNDITYVAAARGAGWGVDYETIICEMQDLAVEYGANPHDVVWEAREDVIGPGIVEYDITAEWSVNRIL
jgi:hypothetical protein